MTDTEKELRQLLWLRHGCPMHMLYGDDGEMQCNNRGCMIDFKRMPVEEIKRAWRSHGELLIEQAGGIHVVLEQIRDKYKDDK